VPVAVIAKITVRIAVLMKVTSKDIRDRQTRPAFLVDSAKCYSLFL
jgi:hypothetical protein